MRHLQQNATTQRILAAAPLAGDLVAIGVGLLVPGVWFAGWPTEIQASDQDVWSRTGRYDQTDTHSSLELFRVLRHANLALLRSLRAEEWEMSGVHAERGAESIRDIAVYYAGHDLHHFKQIEAIRLTLRQ